MVKSVFVLVRNVCRTQNNANCSRIAFRALGHKYMPHIMIHKTGPCNTSTLCVVCLLVFINSSKKIPISYAIPANKKQ